MLTVPAADPEPMYRNELLAIIQAEIDAHPRSHQKEVGPSEIGGCQTKLAFKLAYGGGGGGSGGFAAAKGSVLHAWLDEHVFGADGVPRMPDGSQRFYSDLKLDPVSPHVNGGTLDLYDRLHEIVIDWKLPGDWTMRAVRNGTTSEGYYVQTQVYGLGLEEMGRPVSRVGLMFIPMCGDDLHGHARGAILKTWPYDRALALDRIDNVRRIKDMLDVAGPARVLEVLPKTSDFCVSCPAYLGNGDRRAMCPGAAKERFTPAVHANPFAKS